MEIYSIGFTQKSAREFFETLRVHRIERLLDIRLNNTSQLAGFAKQSDLPYFLEQLCHAKYEHVPLLAPTQEMLDAFKKQKGDWDAYSASYLALLANRKVEAKLSKESFQTRTVLLCSESTAEHCHRRLALEYLQALWGDLTIHHL